MPLMLLKFPTPHLGHVWRYCVTAAVLKHLPGDAHQYADMSLCLMITIMNVHV